jgi:enoyl-[acyl-carrier protein] reductase II
VRRHAWISDAALVKAVNDQGGFGCLAAGNMPGDALAPKSKRPPRRRRRPSRVNLVTIARISRRTRNRAEIEGADGHFRGQLPQEKRRGADEGAGKKVLSFASTDSIADQWCASRDGLILEGSEAGGHIGHVSLMILLQQVLFKKSRRADVRGWRHRDGRMIAHMLLMGAAGVQMGTRFVMSEEQRAPEPEGAFREGPRPRSHEHAGVRQAPDIVAVRALKNKSTEEFAACSSNCCN